jgi:predicted RNase H-like nuclease (RuvC/YqgF family)
VLRKLLVKVFPGNGSVYQAFNLLKTEFHARNSREYEETCAITYLEQEIAAIDEMINDARQGSWNENTARRIENLNAKKQEMKNGVKALEARYLDRVRRTTDFEEADEEYAATAALMKAIQDALNPKEIPLGTVKRF